MNLHLTSAFSEFGARPVPLSAPDISADRLRPIDADRLQETLRGSPYRSAIVLGPLSRPCLDQTSIHRPLEAFATGSLPADWLVDNWSGQVDAFVQAYDQHDTLWVLGSQFLSDLADPRPLLAALKRVCLARSGTVMFVHEDAPGRFRHWSREAFSSFLTAGGFPLQLGDDGWMAATLTLRDYAAYLENRGWDRRLATADWLLLTTEDAGLGPAGGIGTYVRNIKLLDPRAAVLMFDARAEPLDMDRRTLAPRSLADVSFEDFHLGHDSLEVLRNALYLLPSVTLVEAQDYQSILFRIVQAKRTGMLPSWLHLRIFMHGAIDYLKYGFRDEGAVNYSPFEASLAIRDSYIFKHADSCYAPSRYLGQHLMQEEYGYEVANQTIVRLPFDLSLLPDDRPLGYGAIQRIAFIGKYLQLKGWPDFVRAMELLAPGQVQEIVSLAPGVPPDQDIATLSGIAGYSWTHLSHQQLLEYINQHLDDTLFVVPSRGESFSYVVLEQLLLGARLVAYNTGGVVEVADDPDYVSRFFCDPAPDALARKIEDTLRLLPDEHQILVGLARDRLRQRQREVNAWWGRNDAPPYSPEWPRSVELPSPAVTVVAFAGNRTCDQLDEFIRSVHRSRLKPAQVILIGRRPDERVDAVLDAWALDEKNAGLTITLHLHTIDSLGPRDASLQQVQTEFAFFLDDGATLLPRTLEDGWNALSSDPELIAATGFAVNAIEPACFPRSGGVPTESKSWKPLGIPEARALALREDQYMATSAMIRAAAWRDSGGWNDMDPDAWEGMAVYTRLAWKAKRFSLTPQPGHLAPDPNGGRTETAPFLKRRRLVHSLDGLSRLDANILFSLTAYIETGPLPLIKAPVVVPPSETPEAIIQPRQIEHFAYLLLRRVRTRSKRLIGDIKRLL